MRCGKQDRKTRGDVRLCIRKDNAHINTVCGYRGRERYCPRWTQDRRAGEITAKAIPWNAGMTNGRRGDE